MVNRYMVNHGVAEWGPIEADSVEVAWLERQDRPIVGTPEPVQRLVFRTGTGEVVAEYPPDYGWRLIPDPGTLFPMPDRRS